jgi:hypothetical protein
VEEFTTKIEKEIPLGCRDVGEEFLNHAGCLSTPRCVRSFTRFGGG